MNCEHHYCRCLRAQELLFIYDRTGQGRYLQDAIGVHSQRVECRYEQPVRESREANPTKVPR
jgi:hypothetical protein